jgi:protein-S-isoprenylcysteine O-methyltransferase Ste14
MSEPQVPNTTVQPEGTRRPLGPYLARWLGLTVLLLVLYFLPAGRLDLPMSWVLLGSFSAFLLAFGLVYSQSDPGMLQERSKPGPGVKSWDRVWLNVYGVFFFLSYVVAGLGVRFGGVTVPLGLQIAGWALFAAGLALGWWATSVNTFFSRMVRIQEDRGHRVVTEGPYRLVRHPGYVMSILAFPGAALALGSWWGLIPGFIIAALYVYRTAREDRTLQAELPGYAEYAQRVRYRLIPGIW